MSAVTVARPGPRRGLGSWLLGGMAVVFGVATLRGHGWTVWVARGLAISTLLVFAALGVHVLSDGAHEARTPIAMSLRSGFWIAQALVLPHLLDGGHHA